MVPLLLRMLSGEIRHIADGCTKEGTTLPFHPARNWKARAPEVLADQRAAYDEMRGRCPVAHSDALSWSVFRHEDVVAILDDPDTFINSSRYMAIPNAMNGEEHATHREILSRFFTDERMVRVEPHARRIANEVVQALDRSGEVDAVAEIAEPIALKTMCAFMGWPLETWERVRGWIHGNREASFYRDRDAGRRLAGEYAAMVADALEDHRRRGVTEDVTSELMSIEVEGQRWTDEEISATLRNWIAGHGTVTSAISIVIAELAQNQELQRRLRADSSLIPAANEEIPRMDGPLVSNRRTTTREVTIGDQVIPKGERISLMWIAANRDPDAFDAPDEVRLDRDQSDNLLYGHGIHFCLGAPLARLELRVAIETLLAGTSSFSLASPEGMERETLPGNGFVRVPLKLA